MADPAGMLSRVLFCLLIQISCPTPTAWLHYESVDFKYLTTADGYLN